MAPSQDVYAANTLQAVTYRLSSVPAKQLPALIPHVALRQDYSLTSDDWEAALGRFRIFRKDAREYYSGWHGTLFYYARVVRRMIMLAKLWVQR